MFKKILSFCFFVFLMSATLGCQSKPTKQSPNAGLEKTDPLLVFGAKPITFAGLNSQTDLSPDQTRILYVSEKRRAHAHPQIYEYDFLTSKERRLTFQDQANLWPSYFNNDNFLYSSGTEELKENFFSGHSDPAFAKNAFEIYKSDLQGSEMVRWTQRRGPDTQAISWKNGLVFISEDKTSSEIAFQSNPSAVAVKLNDAERGSIRTLKKGRNELVWIESNSLGSAIYSYSSLKQRKTLILRSNGDFQGLAPGPQNGTWITSYRRPNGTDYALILFNQNEKCWVPLLELKANSFLDPVLIQQNNPRLLFTRKTAEQSQIYMMDWPVQMKSCQALVSADKID